MWHREWTTLHQLMLHQGAVKSLTGGQLPTKELRSTVDVYRKRVSRLQKKHLQSAKAIDIIYYRDDVPAFFSLAVAVSDHVTSGGGRMWQTWRKTRRNAARNTEKRKHTRSQCFAVRYKHYKLLGRESEGSKLSFFK